MSEAAYKAFNLLKEKGLKISAAESCTGGMFTKLLTDFPGSSAVLDLSVITYANSAKEKLLGVSRRSIEEYGVVSKEVACQMAKGAARISGADVGVGITGIAGPDGGSESKPVGLVWTAIFFGGNVFAFELRLCGTRDDIRQKTCEIVYNNICDVINRELKKTNNPGTRDI